MYNISISKKIIAQHYLTHEKGREHTLHSHQYKIQIILSGDKLNKYGFLIDIIDVNKIFNNILENFNDQNLNEIQEFKNKTTSIENLSKIIYNRFIQQLKEPNIISVEIKIWENENNWASYKGDIID